MFLADSIGSIYSDKEKHYEDLRILEIYEVFYMISVLAYNKLLFSSKILDSITVDFILKAKDLNNEIFNEVLKNKIPRYKQIYKSLNLIRKGRVLYKALRTTNPVGFLVSISGPIAFESTRIQMRDYIYHRAGRFTLYCYESNRLKRECAFFIPEKI